MIVSTVEGRVGLALAGGGIACVPAPAVREHVRAGRLVRLLEGSVRPVGKLHAVWPRRSAPLVRALLASRRRYRASAERATVAGRSSVLGARAYEAGVVPVS